MKYRIYFTIAVSVCVHVFGILERLWGNIYKLRFIKRERGKENRHIICVFSHFNSHLAQTFMGPALQVRFEVLSDLK